MTGAVTFTVDEGVGWLVIDRPDRRNALSAAMLETLRLRVDEIAERRDVGVVILAGANGSFSAGGDISEWAALSPADFAQHWLRRGHAVFDALARLPQPMIALLEGPVLGGGLELAACADLRIAEDHVSFGQPETDLGIIPGWSGTQRLVRRFGAQAVRRMALFGEVIPARDAQSLGIVDEVVARGEGRAAALSRAKDLLRRAPEATAATKLLLNAAEGEDREAPLEMLAGWAVASAPSLREGISAFREKRKPSFRR